MARRSLTSYVLLSLAGLLVAILLAGWWKSGGISTLLQAPAGVALSTVADMPGITCQRLVMPTKLSASGLLHHDVVGELCSRGTLEGKALQVLVSGAGYGPIYWDFPYQADTYSYVRAALQAGYATFNFYRLGMGESDHPLGILLNVDNQAYVLGQLIDSLRRSHDFSAVFVVGHSFGSVTAIAHALARPESIDGIVLTGFAHNTNPGFITAMRTGVDVAAFKGPFVGKIVDPTYLISKAGTRGGTFYTAENADPVVIEVDELNRQTTAIGEVISSSKYFGPQSKGLTVPVLLVLGDDDFVVCGGALDCRDHARTIAHEQAYFPAARSFEMVMLAHTNHDASLHRGAPAASALILDWMARRVSDLPASRRQSAAPRP
ncbi:MAG: alpha/beta fold hydrolase [Gammaproteobacteria bacterium]